MHGDHFPLFGTRCLRILDDGVCELDRGHDGGHLPYVPGDYLPPPLITPLDLLHLRHWPRSSACPLCGQPVNSVSCEGPTVAYRGTLARGDGAIEMAGGETEFEWRFGPCGCVGREILTSVDRSAGP